jgi:site-specific recombinase XerD
MAMSNKFTLMEIQKQLGHKTIQMTQRYAHLMANQIHEKHNDVFGGF